MASQSDRGGLFSLPTIVLSILAALGITSSGLRQAPAPTQSAATSTTQQSAKPATNEAQDYSHSAAELIEDFLDADSANQLETGKPWSPPGSELWPQSDGRYPASDEQSGYQLDFLIAILPKPTSARLSSEFDNSLEAIELAANNAGFVLDSFDIPWEREARDQSNQVGLGDGIDVSETEGDRRGLILKTHDERKRSELEPGVMLFRCVHENQCHMHLLLLFIAGGTPTHGIDKEPLRSALDQITWLSRWRSGAYCDDEYPAHPKNGVPAVLCQVVPDSVREVRILGPYFSGSACSLRYTIETWLASFSTETPPQVRVISGTASAIKDDLSPHLYKPGKANFAACGLPYAGDERSPASPIQFQSVRIADRDIFHYLRHDLYGLGSDNADDGNSHIAILGDNTAFGQQKVEPLATDKSPPITYMTFPVHISDLRTAFTKSAPPAAAPAPPVSRRNLSLPDESDKPSDDPDVVPPFSKRSASYDELVLDQLMTTIRREHIRYVGVVATDEEDLAFLVHEIRDYSPDVVVFSLTADLGYLRSDINPDLVGMLVFSAYPLFNENQNWTWPFAGEHRLEFPSEDAEGIYNAASALLDNPLGMVEYGQPFAPEPQPPVFWVSVVGHDELWPLGYHSLQSPPAYLYDLPKAAKEAHAPVDPDSLRTALIASGPSLYPPSADILFLLLSVFSLLTALYAFPGLTAGLLMPPRWAAMLLGDAAFAHLERRRRFYLVSFLLGVFTVYSVALAFYCLPLGFESFSIALVGSWRFVAFLIAFWIWIAVFATLVGCFWQIFADVDDETENTNYSGGAWVMLVAGLCGAVAGFIFAGSRWRGEPRFVLFESIRANYMMNGVSPLLPLLYLGLAALTLLACELRRIALLQDCRIIPKFLSFEDDADSFAGVDQLAENIVNRLECKARELPGAWPLTGVVITVVLYFGLTKLRPAHSIEGPWFDLFFIIVAFLVYELFALELLRFVAVWLAVKQLLRRLYFHPFRDSFAALWVKSEHKDQAITLYEPRPSTNAIEHCLERARQLVALANSVQSFPWRGKSPLVTRVINGTASLGATISTAEGLLSYQEPLEQAPDWQDALTGRELLQYLMVALGRLVAGLLEGAWRSGATLNALDETDAKILEQGELFVAGRVVDFLRQVFPQLRSLVFFAMTAVVAMVLATSVYAFPTHNALLWISWSVLLSAITVVIWVFVSINKNRIISMLSGSTPNVFTWDRAFTSQILVYGLLPILALIGGQLPNGLGGIFSWVGGLFGGGK